MNPEIGYVANAFFVGAVVLGLPALAGLLFCIVFGVHLWRLPPQSRAHSTKNPDAVIMTIEGMARVIGAVAGLAGAVGKIVVCLLAAVSAVGLALAGGLFLTGRGLHAQEAWAREAAGFVLVWLTVGSLIALVALRGWRRTLPFFVAVPTVYALNVLWHGFAA